jgi:hypothetical protein
VSEHGGALPKEPEKAFVEVFITFRPKEKRILITLLGVMVRLGVGITWVLFADYYTEAMEKYFERKSLNA